MYGNPESKDYHDTKEQAHAVCEMLKTNGIDLNGRHYPIKTWVEYHKVNNN